MARRRGKRLAGAIESEQIFQGATHAAQEARQAAKKGACGDALRLYEEALIQYGGGRASGGAEQRRQSAQYAIQDARIAMQSCLRKKR